MMKKWIIGFAIAMVVSLSATAEAASDGVKASLFDAKIVVNNNPVQLNADNPLLNYNGRVYVPIRQFSHLGGASVGYDSDSQTIYIDSSPKVHGKPAVRSQAEDDTFTLKLFSKKTEYEEGEPIQIWGRIVREKEGVVTVDHGGSLVGYTLVDSDGVEAYTLPSFLLQSTTFAQGDEYEFQVSNDFFLFNATKQGIADQEQFEAYVNEAKRPGRLPKGAYTIEAFADYSLTGQTTPESNRHLKASISFTVK